MANEYGVGKDKAMALNQMFFDALTEQIPVKVFSDDTEKFPTAITSRIMTFLQANNHVDKETVLFKTS